MTPLHKKLHLKSHMTWLILRQWRPSHSHAAVNYEEAVEFNYAMKWTGGIVFLLEVAWGISIMGYCGLLGDRGWQGGVYLVVSLLFLCFAWRRGGGGISRSEPRERERDFIEWWRPIWEVDSPSMMTTSPPCRKSTEASAIKGTLELIASLINLLFSANFTPFWLISATEFR